MSKHTAQHTEPMFCGLWNVTAQRAIDLLFTTTPLANASGVEFVTALELTTCPALVCGFIDLADNAQSSIIV